MALELHLWKPTRFGGNQRWGKDADVGLSIDARSASSFKAGELGEGRQRWKKKNLVQTKGAC